MTDIVVDFAGWIRISPENVKFVCIGRDMPDIDGFQWLALSEDERVDYILEDAVAAIRDSDDGSWDQIDVMAYNEPEG